MRDGPSPWFSLMSLDVVAFEPQAEDVRFRYSVDAVCGAFTGELDLRVEDERRMAPRLFASLSVETLRRCGQSGAGVPRQIESNYEELSTRLLGFLAGFRRVAGTPDLEPMELAIIRTNGIDFMSRTVSLHDKEIPERIAILLRRAESNLKFGYPEECARELSKLDLLDPGNARAREIRACAAGVAGGPPPVPGRVRTGARSVTPDRSAARSGAATKRAARPSRRKVD